MPLAALLLRGRCDSALESVPAIATRASSTHALARVRDSGAISSAPDGSVWYTAQISGALGKLDPASGETFVTENGQRRATLPRPSAKDDAELAKKKAEYTKLMKDGREALAAEEYDKAAKLFEAAAAADKGDRDHSALVTVYEELARFTIGDAG